MPIDNLIQDAECYISTREGTFNTPVTVGSSFERAGWQNAAVYIPEPEFSTDAGRAGNASEFQTGQCLKRFLPATIGIADRANFRLYGKLAMRCFGGTPLAPVTVVGGVAFRHAANLMPKSAGLQLPSFNAVTFSGGASTLWPGTVVNDFSMSQQGDDDVQVAFGMLTSGKHRIPHLVGTQQVETATAAGTASGNGNVDVTVTAAGMSAAPRVVSVAILSGDTASVWAGKVRTALASDPIVGDFFIVSGATTSIILTSRHTDANDTTLNIALANGTPNPGITPAATSANTTSGAKTLPDPPAFACLDPKPFLEYTDDVGLRDLASDCKWRAWSFALSNNHNPSLARCGGDPRQKRGDYTSTTAPGVGAYANKSVRGQRTITAEIVYLVSNRVSEWEKMCDAIQLTNIKMGARGAVLDGGAPTYEELSAIIPKAKFNGVRGDNVDGYAAFRFSFAAEFDSTAIGARIEVVNGLDGVTPVFN